MLPWRVGARTVDLSTPRVVGVLNVTPDSFSDGALHATLVNARARVDEMRGEGADVVDIGGESTRPGATPVDVGDELTRVIPVVRAVRRDHPDLPLSVDTTKSIVARAALDEGADIINDVSAGRLDSALLTVVGERRAGLILMHSRGTSGELASYRWADYEDAPTAVAHELSEAIACAERAGVPRDAIVIDPGIGFAKRTEHSLAVLRALPRLASLGYPVLVGASRKRVIGELTQVLTPAERVHGSVGVHVAALALGARLFRVHDVRAHRHALDAAWAILGDAPVAPAPTAAMAAPAGTAAMGAPA